MTNIRQEIAVVGLLSSLICQTRRNKYGIIVVTKQRLFQSGSSLAWILSKSAYTLQFFTC